MKIFLVSFFSLALFGSSLRVEVENILNSNGMIEIGLYNKDEDFRKREAVFKGVDLKAQMGKISYTFKDIPEGVYAISIIHDENENLKLDNNFLGIPSEGYGFSNNLRPMFRGANFEESKFELKGDKEITIKMGY